MRTIAVGELLDRCLKSRRNEDWQQFILQAGRIIRYHIRQATRERRLPLQEQDLEDYMQDFYCRLLTLRSRQFRGRSEGELWLYLQQVAQTMMTDHLRARLSQKRWPDPRRRFSSEGSDCFPRLPEAELHRRSPEVRVLHRERRQYFRRLCLEIVRRERRALELRALSLAFLGGWSSREVAHRLHGKMSRQQVDTLVRRLRRHLANRGIRLPRRSGSGQLSATGDGSEKVMES